MRIAVIGAGISGLATGWLLARQHSVTLFEAAAYLGGHTNTVDVCLDGLSHPVDTGFLVFNRRTYPNLTALFETLDVPIAQSEMSFAVSLSEPAIEWSGSSLATIFAQRANLARPAFWRMLQDIFRFNREVVANAEGGGGCRSVNTSIAIAIASNSATGICCRWLRRYGRARRRRCSIIRSPPSFAFAAIMGCCSFSTGRNG